MHKEYRMFSFTVNKLSEKVTQIVDATGVSCFLVTGAKSALLIDTCVGLGDLSAAVSDITPLPVTVVLTHGHGDHTGNASQFENVYLSPVDIPLLKEHNIDMRTEYANMMLPENFKVKPENLSKDLSKPTMLLEGGKVFDLGKVNVELIPVPGHTKGCMCALVKEEKVIILGDACNGNTLIFGEHSSTISEYRDALKKLSERSGEFYTAYFSHGPAVGPVQCIEDNIELCNKILKGEDDAIEFSFLNLTLLRAANADEQFRRPDGKFGNIAYQKTLAK